MRVLSVLSHVDLYVGHTLNCRSRCRSPAPLRSARFPRSGPDRRVFSVLRICERDVEIIKQPHGSRPRAGLLVPLYQYRVREGGARSECALRSLLTRHEGDVTLS